MDWLLLVLILAFTFWSFQMVIVYRRQIERYDEQTAQVVANTSEVIAQLEKYEADHAEKKEELDTLRKEMEGMDSKEKEMGEKIKTLKGVNDGRRPTRFRLDNVDPSGS
jgi:DNA repair exonuclease SbcCD ATPase subunit